MIQLNTLIRANIRQLSPYVSAREELSPGRELLLDANENPYGKRANRYPDPLQTELKRRIAKLEALSPNNIFLGNGSDEIIDLVIRLFCKPGKDNLITTAPTYGMYKVLAQINEVTVKESPLTKEFALSAKDLLSRCDQNTKLIILCSPNNPTGNLLSKKEIRHILTQFNGIVLLDEAYIDFSENKGWLSELENFPNLIILQTFSKSWGLAGIRLGKAFASSEIIEPLNKIKFPYNISSLNQKHAAKALKQRATIQKNIQKLIRERKKLSEALTTFEFVERIYPSDANFILFRVKNASALLHFMKQSGVLLRDRSGLAGCQGCIRLTVGTPRQNKVVLKRMQQFERRLS